MNKVKDGTPDFSSKSMCTTCRNCHRFETVNEVVWLCDEIYGNARVPQPVIKCNKYDDKTRPTLGQYMMLAWTLRTDSSGKTIGFMSPKDLRKLRKSGEEPHQHEEAPLQIPWELNE